MTRTERPTGIVWSYRRESETMFHGNFETRHEAIGFAAIIGRITGEEVHVRWHESMWREMDEPVVCDYCGYEEHYRPLVRWTFVLNGPHAGHYCTTHCAARAELAEVDR